MNSEAYAILGIRIDSDGAVEASQNLEEMKRAADGAARAADNTTEAIYLSRSKRSMYPAPKVHSPKVHSKTTSCTTATNRLAVECGKIWWHRQPSLLCCSMQRSRARRGFVVTAPINPPAKATLTILFSFIGCSLIEGNMTFGLYTVWIINVAGRLTSPPREIQMSYFQAGAKILRSSVRQGRQKEPSHTMHVLYPQKICSQETIQ